MIEYLGIEHEQYFQGYSGIVGCGGTPRKALEDCLDCVSLTLDKETFDKIESEIEFDDFPDNSDEELGDDFHYYVGFRG